MQLDAVNQLMREGNAISGGLLLVDGSDMNELHSDLKTTPRVATVTVKSHTVNNFRRTIAENLLRMRAFVVASAMVIAVGVVYNTARIALAERSRELATLRVLGFSRNEITVVLVGELALLTAAAIPTGWAIGYGLAAAVIELSYDTELFRIPLVVSRFTYAFAAAVTLLSAVGSSLLLRRIVNRLDMIAVLKAGE
jgi:putative ABC transport system permease protein